VAWNAETTRTDYLNRTGTLRGDDQMPRAAHRPAGGAPGLPAPVSTFIGREADLLELGRLARRSRLVTITGAAGLGKTRLAIELAGRLAGQEVAAALGVGERPGEPVAATLAAHIGGRRLLLVVDNCEHLVDDCARLAEALLRGCPGLRILATGRRQLRVTGELVWRIGPLSLPDRAPAGLAAIGASEAVRLFDARARLVDPGFALDAANAAVVGLLCRRLDGIPLAIELAAARSRSLSPRELLARLEDRFRLLRAGGRAAVPRHRTLRAALDWDHQLLEEPERRLFRRLAVFRGGFDVEAAEAVGAGDDLAAEEVLGLVLGLVEKSLLAPDLGHGGPTRYRLLETVREYAAQRLRESGDQAPAERRHAVHHAGLAARGERGERGPEHLAWLARLETDHDNLRAALAWCRRHDPELGLRMASSLTWFWVTRGHFSEGRRWLDDALAAAPDEAAAGAAGLLALARLSFWQGDYETARAACERSLERSAARGDAADRGWALVLLGSIEAYRGNLASSRRLLEEVLASDPELDLRMEALVALGEVLLQDGELGAARVHLAEVRALARGPQAPRGRAALFLGLAAFFDGAQAGAVRYLAESLQVFRELGNRYAAAASLDALAAVAVAAGDPLRALRLSGAAAGLREATGARLAPRWRDLVETAVIEPARRSVGRALGQERADAAWAEAAELTLDQAVEAALAGLPEPPVIATAEAGRSRRPAGLSERELEVAHLVAQGLTNRQIAERLGIAERTAEGHVERVRKKLNVRSRRQVAVSIARQSAWR